MLSVLICCLPTATVLAENIDFHAPGGEGTAIIYSGEKLYGSGDVLYIFYKTPQGDVRTEAHPASQALADGYAVEPINGYNAWRYIETTGAGPYYTYLEAIYEPTPPAQPVKEEKSEKKHYQQTPTSWLSNPNEISAFYYKDGKIDMKAKFGKAEQGEACKASFSAALPPMWKQAFTFSMSYDGKHTTDLKDGNFVLYIPPDLQKSGREFAIMAIDKYGLVHTYYDTDTLANVFTTKLGFEGYAFALIYKD